MPTTEPSGRAGAHDALAGFRNQADGLAPSSERDLVLAFDTSNEVVTLGLARIVADGRLEVVESRVIPAHRASNTQLIPQIDRLMDEAGQRRGSLACIAVGRGPGSFTGVRIAMATAKGISQALEVGLVGLSTLDAIAWDAQLKGVRGPIAVVADAMRGEVYPVAYELSDAGVERLGADRVVKAQDAADGFAGMGGLRFTGDALVKYADLFARHGELLGQDHWYATGAGLIACLQCAWEEGRIDPLDARRHDPALALPVYTRLSDAEENERARLSSLEPKNLRTGVQDARAKAHPSMHESSPIDANQVVKGILYRPLDAAHAADVAALEARVMDGESWSERMILDELAQRDRVWWAAYGAPDGEGAGITDETLASDLRLAGYAGCLVVDGEMQVLRIGSDERLRRRGIASELMKRMARDARDLGADRCMLEVRVGNRAAQAFYRSMGLADAGVRPRYYSDGEDALIMTGAVPAGTHRAGGMEVREQEENEAASAEPKRPLIFAIESSCDETAAAIVDGEGNLLADVVASQIDFHSRFGGVVPEIASRKHIEAICGVCEECFSVAAGNLGRTGLSWSDMDAVSVTYAPGLVGALVVGVAFAKGAAWAAGKPFIGVNHLEGHLYANKIGATDVEPPMVASLVSGGNTLLVHVRGWGDYRVLGSTIDDAVGEAFDKVAKALGLGYPGGPVISKFAAKGDPSAIAFPRAMMHSGDLRFSLSGLKTAVVSHINAERAAGREPNVPDIAASFQQAVIDVQVAKSAAALDETGAPLFCLGGGVAANPALRAAYEKMCSERSVRLIMPPLRSCGDNAGMIALVALDRYRDGRFFGLDADARARTDLEQPY